MCESKLISAIVKELAGSFRGQILTGEPMSRHTTWKTGGPADLFLIPENLKSLILALKITRQHSLPFFILGNGSNLLVSDEGIAGMVIRLGKSFARTRWRENRVYAGCALSLGSLVGAAVKRGLGGMEKLSGIPGSLGGALKMNAGAYGQEISQVLVRVKILTPELKISWLKKENLDFAYRKSPFPRSAILLGSELDLIPGDKEKLRKEKEEIILKRRKSHPDGASAGSTFVNPPGGKAWQLIEAAGLRGYRLGAAQVSEKHPNFILNLGGATAQEIWRLIQKIQAEVKAKTGIQLETEIERAGKW